MTREEWETHVKSLAMSGMTVEAYAAKAGVHPGTLAGWRSKLKRPSTAKAAKRKQVEITLVREQEPASMPEVGTIELVVGGARILIRGRVEAEALAPVLVALGERR